MKLAKLTTLLLVACFVANEVVGQKPSPPAKKKSPTAKKSPSAKKTPSPQATSKAKSKSPSSLAKLSQPFKGVNLWIDHKRRIVVIDGKVCLRDGPLEMFACPRGTKEHESIISLDCKGFQVHAALLAVGARSGKPVAFRPKYRAASGTAVDLIVLWIDKNGKKQRVKAQKWIRNVRTRQKLQQTWVFAGSGFWTDPKTKRRYYHADSGDLICVSNFPTATLDLPVKSTQANEGLLFEANTKAIPTLDTKVRLVLVPRLATIKPRKKK